MRYPRPVTPAELSAPLKALRDEIAPGSAPAYVDVRPLPGAPINECFPIVQAHVATHGGAMVIGWSLWEMPALFVEAEFHAVWRSPEGALLDLAPKAAPIKRIFFLPDPTRIYDGRQIDNVRRAVVQAPLVAAYLQLFAEQFEILNRGQRADQHGEITLTNAEAAEYTEIQRRFAMLQLQLANRFPTVGPYTPCPCGSGVKTKWCCKDLLRA